MSIEYALLSTFVLGIFSTVIAVRHATKDEMRPSGALTVFLLNFLPVVGPVAAALGMIAWHRDARSSVRVQAINAIR